MTPADRAEELLAKWRREPTQWTGDMSLDIERAIKAALEEQREELTKAAVAAADGAIDVAMELVIQAEREECAKIANEAADRVQSRNQFGDGMRSIADCIANKIRARSDA